MEMWVKEEETAGEKDLLGIENVVKKESTVLPVLVGEQ